MNSAYKTRRLTLIEAQGIGRSMYILMLVCKYLRSFIAILSPRPFINWGRTILPIRPNAYWEEVWWVLYRLITSVFSYRLVTVVLIAIVLVPLISSCTVNIPKAQAGEARLAAFWQRSITQLDLFSIITAWTVGLVLVMASIRLLSSFAIKKRRLRSIIGPTMVYSCLHLEKHESLQTMKAVIERAIEKPLYDGLLLENLVSACDLIATADQISSGYAHQAADEIIQYIDRHYPDLRGRFVGISDNEHLRPMRDGLISGALALGDVDKVHHFVIE